jgi:hypothetical protein
MVWFNLYDKESLKNRKLEKLLELKAGSPPPPLLSFSNKLK